MDLYVKKPIPIEATEYSFGLEDGFDSIDKAIKNGYDENNYDKDFCNGMIPYITTLEGKHYINKGDFIIIGVEGEKYPCKRSIFIKTYSKI